MKGKLTEEEWNRVKNILYSLFDLTWEFAELLAKNVVNSFEESKPTRLLNEPFKNYNQRLINWNESKTEIYSKTFESAKTKSFNIVKELEMYLIKLGLPEKE